MLRDVFVLRLPEIRRHTIHSVFNFSRGARTERKSRSPTSCLSPQPKPHLWPVLRQKTMRNENSKCTNLFFTTSMALLNSSPPVGIKFLATYTLFLLELAAGGSRKVGKWHRFDPLRVPNDLLFHFPLVTSSSMSMTASPSKKIFHAATCGDLR